MTAEIKVGIVGYGNVGMGVEAAISNNPDMKLTAVFTRRDPTALKVRTPGVAIYPESQAQRHVDALDVVILCGGSATDLPEQGPRFAALFNTVDSYDTHAKIPEYFKALDRAAKKAKKTCVISTGWDPGLFSLLRVIEEAVLPDGKGYTFWGPGVSQGHSDAARRIEGVADARQYTIPIEGAIEKVRSGSAPELSTREKHLRDCYVVAAKDADRERIRREIATMPNYFADYDTKVTFVSEAEMAEKHGKMPHGGFVIRSGGTGQGHRHIVEFSLKLDSNPEFTGNVLVAYARAVARLNKEGQTGAKTVLDIPASYLSMKSPEALRKDYL
ncbi:MAG: diaminopimelate dehydrogenase [Deltaproteobacteria bacterium]|nr:diaminopimelate dehydrogenase [Deltaproteobacteria bacterium]